MTQHAPKPSVSPANEKLRSYGFQQVVTTRAGWRFELDGGHDRPCYDDAGVAEALRDEQEPCPAGCECGHGGRATDGRCEACGAWLDDRGQCPDERDHDAGVIPPDEETEQDRIDAHMAAMGMQVAQIAPAAEALDADDVAALSAVFPDADIIVPHSGFAEAPIEVLEEIRLGMIAELAAGDDRPMVPAPSAAPAVLDGATHGIVAVEDSAAAGAMVWWRLSGTTDVAKLAAAWAAAGLPEEEALGEATPAAALAAAVRAQRTKHVLVRPLPAGEGWAIVRETTDAAANDLSWATGLKVSRTQYSEEELAVTGATSNNLLRFDPPDHPAAEQIRADYAAALVSQSTGEVGGWVARLLRRHHDAIGLRESGGVYFVPAPKVADWKRRAAVVKSVTAHTFALVPAMRTEDAVAAVLDALVSEAGTEAAELEREVVSGELSARSLETRAEKARALGEKVARYGAVLGAAAPELSARLEQLRATAAAAALAARAQEAK